jgi:hypothetical protein
MSVRAYHSTLHAQQLSRVRSLLSRLVCALTEIEEGSENHALALEFMMEHAAAAPAYPRADPGDVAAGVAAAAQKFSLHNNGVMGTRLLQLHADLRAAMAGGRRDPRADEGDGAIDGGDGSREAAFVRLVALLLHLARRAQYAPGGPARARGGGGGGESADAAGAVPPDAPDAAAAAPRDPLVEAYLAAWRGDAGGSDDEDDSGGSSDGGGEGEAGEAAAAAAAADAPDGDADARAHERGQRMLDAPDVSVRV